MVKIVEDEKFKKLDAVLFAAIQRNLAGNPDEDTLISKVASETGVPVDDVRDYYLSVILY